jgi:hypothetical protein
MSRIAKAVYLYNRFNRAVKAVSDNLDPSKEGYLKACASYAGGKLDEVLARLDSQEALDVIPLIRA